MKFGKIAMVALFVAVAGLSGCASWTQQCNTKQAYQDGKDDGMTPGMTMNPNYGAACLKANRQALDAAYESGYKAGLPKRAEVAQQTQQLINSSGNHH